MKLTSDFFISSVQKNTTESAHPLFFNLHNGGLFVFESDYELLTVISPFYCIIQLSRGSASITISPDLTDPRECSLTRGCNLLIAPETRFSIHAQKGAELNILLFSGSLTAAYLTDDIHTSRYLLINQTLVSYSQQLSRILKSFKDSPQHCLTGKKDILWNHKMLTDLMTYLYLSAALPENSSSLTIPAYLKTIKQYLDEHYALPFHLEEAAIRAGVSKYKFSHDFSLFYGKPPLKYINELRIEYAKEFLISCDIPVHEIGSVVGIENTNHFIQLFKRYTGMTPNQFRQTYSL